MGKVVLDVHTGMAVLLNLPNELQDFADLVHGERHSRLVEHNEGGVAMHRPTETPWRSPPDNSFTVESTPIPAPRKPIALSRICSAIAFSRLTSMKPNR